MKTEDILTRVGTVLMLFSAAWNFIMSGIWFISLFWLLVGFLWLVPMMLVVVEVLLAFALMIFGFNKAAPLAPLLGMFISVCNFNVIGFGIELLAFLLMVGGFAVQMSNKDAAAV